MSSTFDEEAAQSAGSVASTKSTSDLSNSLEQSLSSIAIQSAESQLTQKLSSVVPESVAGVAATEVVSTAGAAITGSNSSSGASSAIAASELTNAAESQLTQKLSSVVPESVAGVAATEVVSTASAAITGSSSGASSAIAGSELTNAEATPIMKAAMSLVNQRNIKLPTDAETIASQLSASRTVSVAGPAMPSVLGMPALMFSSMQGEEKLGELYQYTLTLRTPSVRVGSTATAAANIDLKSMVGKELTVSIALEGIDSGTREISGLVTSAYFIGAEKDYSKYVVILEPWLTLANRTSDFKIFQEVTAIDILDQVLQDYNYPVEKRIIGSYPKRVYQVQYGETDFIFLSRIMQEWGLYYYFEHSKGAHRMIICDSISSHHPYSSPAYSNLNYYPNQSKVDDEYISIFELRESLMPSKLVTNDYDFKKPKADLAANSEMPRKTVHNDLELYQWPGDYSNPEEGKMLARVHMEEAGAEGSRSHGHGNVRAIVCGCTFTLQKHPNEKANREYIANPL